MQTKRKKILQVHELVVLVIIGVVLGKAPTLIEYYPNSSEKAEVLGEEKIREERTEAVLYSKNIYYCTSLCYTPPEVPKPVVKIPRFVARSRQGGTTRVVEIPAKAKNPNTIRIPLREAPPILAEVKMVNGRPTCAKKNDKGRKSRKYNHVHVDQECCLDPDEVPNPRCVYR